MDHRKWVMATLLAVAAGALHFSAVATEPQPGAVSGLAAADDAQFKKAAVKFLQSAQAYLGVTTLQWQNLMMVPRAGDVSAISTSNMEYKAQIAKEFNELMATPGGSEALTSKLKDYYAAWGLAFDSMRPTSADTPRGYPARTNTEIQRMEATAARLKMDL